MAGVVQEGGRRELLTELMEAIVAIQQLVATAPLVMEHQRLIDKGLHKIQKNNATRPALALPG